MTHSRFARRSGFTLVELLVAMALIVVLATIALAVVPDVLNQDRTTDAAGSVRQWLTIAKARAARDQQPRGVRFLVATDPNNPAKSNPLWVTELQYTEALPVLPLTDSKAQFTNVFLTFSCSYDAAGAIILNSAASPPSPQCKISNLALSDAVQIVPGSLLTVSTLGSAYRVLAVPNPAAPTPPNNPVMAANGSFTLTVVLDSFPQAQLGSAGQASQTLLPVFTTTLFGITAPPSPLLGEPILPLPKNICIDLSSSQPVVGGGSDLDIVFLPSGQVVPNSAAAASNQIFFWVRDYTKNGGSSPTAVFAQGGEQQVVSLKTKSGALGTFPVMWPPYGAGQDAFTFARQGATSP